MERLRAVRDHVAAATSSNDCTYFWGAPAPQSSGCFNPFNNGLSDDEESVS